MLRWLNKWRQKPVFDGEIGRMVIVSAPAGAGKSTFMDNPHAVLGLQDFPDQLTDFSRLARSYLHMFQLYRRRSRRLKNVVVHYDILAPCLEAATSLQDHSELAGSIDSATFRDHRKLGEYCERAEVLDIVILFVRRQKNLQRWSARQLSEEASRRSEAARPILQDDTNNSELHRAIYRAWLQFAESAGPRSITVIDGNEDDRYAVMKIDDFRRELDDGYRAAV